MLGHVFVCILLSWSFPIPFLLLVSFVSCHLLSELFLHVMDNGWDLEDMEMMVRMGWWMWEGENRMLCTRWLGRSCGG